MVEIKRQNPIGRYLGLLVFGGFIYYFYFFGSADHISKAQYDQITDGMSYSEVAKIVGKEGTESASSTVPGVPGFSGETKIKMYAWKNSNGSNALLTFQNDKLTMKAQAGLK